VPGLETEQNKIYVLHRALLREPKITLFPASIVPSC
jgi:hypothetical protein